ncbi:MAG: N-acetyl-gamma-glutamyl-phosphate reductase, partial [Candidatus Adiutrix sp.]|nr:N-acetyl-gamma-glutamyl-phosphate reductase [Candidatus Adiutrix sp.]
RTSDVRGSNFCDISIYYDQRANLAKIISAVDNLVRGASGQALVNFNLMCGHPPAAGLDFAPLRP